MGGFVEGVAVARPLKTHQASSDREEGTASRRGGTVEAWAPSGLIHGTFWDWRGVCGQSGEHAGSWLERRQEGQGGPTQIRLVYPCGGCSLYLPAGLVVPGSPEEILYNS